MKTIEQVVGDLELDIMENTAWIDHLGHSIIIDKQGAKQLIEVLKEWVESE